MSAIDVFPEACSTVSAIVQAAGSADLGRPTPCGDFDVLQLVRHVTGTTTALARVGARQALDPEDPWGAHTQVDPATWPVGLITRLDALHSVWSQPEAWLGTVDTGGGEMPARAIGEMALAEVVLHGWDLARATDQDLRVSADLGAEVARMVEETGELGRRMGAYGAAVETVGAATDFERALGAAGRDPHWRP